MMTSCCIEEDLKLETDINSCLQCLLREYIKTEVESRDRLLYNQRSRPLVVRRENAGGAFALLFRTGGFRLTLRLKRNVVAGEETKCLYIYIVFSRNVLKGAPDAAV